jgi:hypothetical protein
VVVRAAINPIIAACTVADKGYNLGNWIVPYSHGLEKSGDRPSATVHQSNQAVVIGFIVVSLFLPNV